MQVKGYLYIKIENPIPEGVRSQNSNVGDSGGAPRSEIWVKSFPAFVLDWNFVVARAVFST